MFRLLEDIALTALNLSISQQKLLAMIFSAPTFDEAAGKKVDIQSSVEADKLALARRTLTDIGLITYNETSDLYTITDSGMEMMREEGLTDETGALTQKAQDLAANEDEKHNNRSPGMAPGSDVPGMTQDPKDNMSSVFSGNSMAPGSGAADTSPMGMKGPRESFIGFLKNTSSLNGIAALAEQNRAKISSTVKS